MDSLPFTSNLWKEIFSRESKGVLTSSKIVFIQATSAGYGAGNYAKISINDIPIEMDKNENDHFRGLHIVIIDPNEDGPMIVKKVFDTYKSSEMLENFLKDP